MYGAGTIHKERGAESSEALCGAVSRYKANGPLMLSRHTLTGCVTCRRCQKAMTRNTNRSK
jgi:hypothetical protein